MKKRRPEQGGRPLQAKSFNPGDGPDDAAYGARPFLISLVVHVALFVIIGVAGGLTPRHTYHPSMIEIDLATLSDQGGDSTSGGPVVKKPPPRQARQEAAVKEKPEPPASKPEPAPQTTKVQKPAMAIPQEKKPDPTAPAASESPEQPQVIRSMKQKTYDPSEVVQSAIKQIEKKVEKTGSQPSYLSAIKNLKEKVGEVNPRGGSGDSEPGKEGGGIPGGAGTHDKRALRQMDIYQLEIAGIIEKNWAFPEQLATGRNDLEAVLVITIAANGQIKDIWFEKKSGNRYVDDAAFKAIKKSNPLPPLPQGLSSTTMGMIFTPSGLKQNN